MALKPAGRIGAVLRELALAWRAAALALVLLGLLLIVSSLPIASVELNRIFSHTVGPFAFLVAASLYAWRSSSGAGFDPERRFWRKLSVGFGIWAFTYVPSLLTRLETNTIDPILPYLDFGFALSFVFVVAAVEERPDDRSAITEMARRPSLWHSLLLTTGFFVTLILLPSLYNLGAYSSFLSSYGYFVAMDLAVAIRLLYFAYQSESSRWRVVYCILSGGFLLMAVVDFATGSMRREGLPLTVGAFYDAFWTLPYLVLLLGAASGRLRLEDHRSGLREPTLSDAIAASTLTWALLFPAFHFVADRTRWLDPALGPKRDVAVLIWTLLLMGLAIKRQHRLEQGLVGLVREQRDIEGNLRDSEKDLRLLVERGRVSDRLKAAEERFTKAFEVSPDGLILSSFEEGTIFDVNPAFERLTLLSRSACIGRRATELGLWPHPERRDRLIQLLRRRQQMHDLPGELHRADGRVRPVRAYYERIQQVDGDILLTVLRDSGNGGEGQSERVATLLENARIPLRLVRETEAEGEAVAVFVNASARLALRQEEGTEVEVAGPNGLRLLMHFGREEGEPA